MISIITVVFNGENTIGQTLESVCNQSILPSEYIIIDGLSTDNTLSIVKDHMNRYPFIKLISEKDNGIYDAMNKGIMMAKGELIGIIASDDWYEPDAFEKVITAYKTYGPGVYYGILRYILNGKELLLERGNHQFLGKKMIPHPATFVSADIYRIHGLFNLKYRFSSDLEIFIRYYNNKVMFYPIDFILANFRIGGASSTTKAEMETISLSKKYGIINSKQYFFQYLKLKFKSLINY